MSDEETPKRIHPDILAPGEKAPAPPVRASEATAHIIGDMSPQELADFLRTLSRTENPASVAKRFGISEDAVREAWKPKKE